MKKNKIYLELYIKTKNKDLLKIEIKKWEEEGFKSEDIVEEYPNDVWYCYLYKIKA